MQGQFYFLRFRKSSQRITLLKNHFADLDSNQIKSQIPETSKEFHVTSLNADHLGLILWRSRVLSEFWVRGKSLWNSEGGGDFQDASDSVMPVSRCYARFEVLTTVLMNIKVFWNIMLCP